MNKKLREIRQGGLVRLRSNRLRILDWSGLCKLAEFDPDYLHLREVSLQELNGSERAAL